MYTASPYWVVNDTKTVYDCVLNKYNIFTSTFNHWQYCVRKVNETKQGPGEPASSREGHSHQHSRVLSGVVGGRALVCLVTTTILHLTTIHFVLVQS